MRRRRDRSDVGAVGDAELGEDVGDMRLHRLRRHQQPRRDLRVRQTLGEQGDDAQLGGRQRCPAVADRASLGPGALQVGDPVVDAEGVALLLGRGELVAERTTRRDHVGREARALRFAAEAQSERVTKPPGDPDGATGIHPRGARHERGRRGSPGW